MKLLPPPVHSRRRRGGWALAIVMLLSVGALLVAASIVGWSNVGASNVARSNEYYATSYAAEAATEKALAAIVTDYENYGAPLVYSKLSTYSNIVPTSSDDLYWGNYTYTAGAGQTNLVVVSLINPTNIVVMGPPYAGLIMNAATYQIISTARNIGGYNIGACVGQQFNLGTIPIFQFAIFYQNTMEIDPGANMTINGFTHGNSGIFIDPNSGVTLTFSNDVSSSSTIVLGENPLDPTSGRNASPNPAFDGFHLSGVNPLILPVGTNSSGVATNTAANVNAILQIPPAGTSPTSQTGSNYLYNKADMIILLSNNSVKVTSGVLLNNQATVISNAAWSLWLNTNANTQFYDQRQGITIQTADIDVGKLAAWSATNNSLRPAIIAKGRSGDLNSVYIADERANSNAVITTNVSYSTNQVATNTTPRLSYPGSGTFFPPVTTNTILVTNANRPTNGTYLGSYTQSSNPTRYIYQLINGYSYQLITGVVTNYTYITNWNVVSQAGVVLTNGATLPPMGLGVATPDPVFIVGNYNVSTNGTPVNLGTFNTSQTRPAAVYSDAVTILSPNWNPLNSSNSIGSRTAANDTVNAALLTGNVPSDGNYYSGGVENFPRFLENWSGYTLTYNGSMVCMFNSQVATDPWPGTGTVYNPPTRNWAFDLNFNNPAKQPPMMPLVISVNRGAWTFLQTNSVSF